MKVLLITLFLVELTTSELPAYNLGQILQSPGQTLKLYSAYKADEHLAFGASENRVRFSVFKKNVRLVSALNSDAGESVEFGLNIFSSMTDSEKKQWLGLNATGQQPNPPGSQDFLSSLNIPPRWDWVEKGMVTEVENQGGCGSCWAWGAVGAMDTQYKIKSGRLKSFSVQEYLDCSYLERDGCKGGWYTHGYKYSMRYGGRLASTTDYPYTAKQETCKGASTPNAATAYKIKGVRPVDGDEISNIKALSKGALAMAILVKTKFFQYKNGIFKETDCSETDRPNHAVTGVGYTENYFVIKNSWGRKWGKGGFMRMARNYHHCGLWKRSEYPILVSTGERDRGTDWKKARYEWGEDDGEVDDRGDSNSNNEKKKRNSNSRSDEKCEDKLKTEELTHCRSEMCKYERFSEEWCRKTCRFCGHGGCLDEHDHCENDFCEFEDFSAKYCRYSCGICGDEEGEEGEEEEKEEEEEEEEQGCGNGLTMCPDGICRHEHMCH